MELPILLYYIPFSDWQLGKIASKLTHFPFELCEFYPFVYFRIFVNFWSIELVPSERWSQPAVRTEMLMEGGGLGTGFKIFNIAIFDIFKIAIFEILNIAIPKIFKIAILKLFKIAIFEHTS